MLSSFINTLFVSILKNIIKASMREQKYESILRSQNTYDATSLPNITTQTSCPPPPPTLQTKMRDRRERELYLPLNKS